MYIAAAVNYLTGNAEYLYSSITDALSLVEHTVAICCNWTSLLWSLPVQQIPHLKGHHKCSFDPTQGTRVYFVTLCVIGGFRHAKTFIKGYGSRRALVMLVKKLKKGSNCEPQPMSRLHTCEHKHTHSHSNA